MQKKTLASAAGAALVLAIGVSSPYSAAAASPEADRLWSAQQEQELREFWTTNDVPGEVQARLIDDGRRGIHPDSMDRDAAAVRTVTTREDFEVVTTSTYADGSVAVASLELLRPAPKGANVERCTVGAKCAQPFRDREKKKQDAAGYAGSSWGMSADVLGFGLTYYLTLSVGGDKATAKFG